MKSIDNELKDLQETLKLKYKIKDIRLFYYTVNDEKSLTIRNIIMINLLMIKKRHRNTGIGSSVMNEICNFADENKCFLTLRTSTKFGSSIKRLVSFYDKFDFIEKDTNIIKDSIFKGRLFIRHYK